MNDDNQNPVSQNKAITPKPTEEEFDQDLNDSSEDAADIDKVYRKAFGNNPSGPVDVAKEVNKDEKDRWEE